MNAILLPLITPFVGAIGSWTFRKTPSVSKAIQIVFLGLQLILSILLVLQVSNEGIQTLQFANWKAPFGITLVADRLAAGMLVLTGLVGFAAGLFSTNDVPNSAWHRGFGFFFQMQVFGVSGAFLTGDIFNLYVWIEVLLVSSFALFAISGTRASLEGLFKYFLLNVFGSTIFLLGCGLIYNSTGTLNLAQLAQLRGGQQSATWSLAVTMVLFAFLSKSAVFPLFGWLPASYHTPAASVSSFVGGLLTKVGVYGLVRLTTLMVPKQHFAELLSNIALVTMVIGVLGAAIQTNIRKILSFHIVSQVGYLVWGIALGSVESLAATAFYLAHNIIAKSNLFLIAGIVGAKTGIEDVRRLGSMKESCPWLAVLFLVSALALAGFPPLSGFWAKLLLVRSGLSVKDYLGVFVALLVGVMTTYSMTKIWAEVFWKEQTDSVMVQNSRKRVTFLYFPVWILVAGTLCLSFGSNLFINFGTAIGEELLNPRHYIDAVLKEGTP